MARPRNRPPQDDEWRPTAEQQAEVLRRIDLVPSTATGTDPAVAELATYLQRERLAEHRLRPSQTVPEQTAAELARTLATIRERFE